MSPTRSRVEPGAGQNCAEDLEARNADACGRSIHCVGEATARSKSRDNKRARAAQLAQDLSSSGSWSDRFLLSTSDMTLSRQGYPQTAARQEQGNTQDISTRSRNELDPPPAYSHAPIIHELPATPVNDVPRGAHPENTQLDPWNRLEQSQDDGASAADDQTPLLGRLRRRRRNGRWREWVRKGRTSKQRRCRFLSIVAAFMVLASLLMCVFGTVLRNKSTWTETPSRPSYTYIPTGPDYARHEPTDTITGAYKLYDRLDLSTTTGTIDIELDPQHGDSAAVLILSSQTGSITLRLAPDFLSRQDKAWRAIHTEIRSLTGSVTAEILLGRGSYALVDTSTGTQQLSILTHNVGPHDEVSEIQTFSKTGTQRVTLVPLKRDESFITSINAEHHSLATASLDINYPFSWEGDVYAIASRIGSVTVRGPDLEYSEKEDHRIVAHRGLPQHREVIKVVSDGTGSITFNC